ncbi:SCO family protein [Roseospirillum parvum]|uniref:Protein SCO1/2 n=1 Tax=Roseospirillum parvum TaxID=83401 RepID=A0A1G7WVE1_9PROT|nr:SCO family protein [Roseospirillum parvum]SDG75846.1 protein SCO1/2 [Roseospirillum parvum]
MAADPPRAAQKRTFTLLAAVLLVIGLGLGGRFWLLAPDDSPAGTTIGGPFILTRADTGATTTEADFAGRLMLVYFGYTFCPDICPTSLGTISQALDALTPAQRAHIAPLFITVDPARDTAQVVAGYVAAFHTDLIGLTGDPDNLEAAARTYRVTHEKVPDPEGNPDHYTIDHSSLVYLMGPDGTYRRHFPHGTPAQIMADGLREELAASGLSS